MGSISWGTISISSKFDKEWNSVGRAKLVYIALEGLQRVIEGADITEGMVQISEIIQLGHH